MQQQAPQPDREDLASLSVHPDCSPHKGFSFDEDKWDLNYRSSVARPCDGRISFTAFAPSVKNYVKEFVANGMLVLGLSNGWVHKTMAALRKAFRFFEKRHGHALSPLELTRYDAFALEEHFCQTGIEAARAQLAIVARFAAFLREQYNDLPTDFRPNPMMAPKIEHTKRSFTEGLEQVIPDEVSEALMEAIGRHQLFLDAKVKKSKAQYLQSHQLYLTALVLLFFSGRRISEVLLLRRECLREPSSDEQAKTGEGVWLVYHNTKVGLGQQEIFVTEPAAGLVRTMVERAIVVTNSLVQTGEQDGLFLTDSRYAGIRGVSANAFDAWLNGQEAENGYIARVGFIHRYNIKFHDEYYHINPHQMRHTLSYKAYMGGASYVDVGDHLQHRRTINGLSPMTGVYIHGQEKDVKQIREMHAKRLVSGKSVPLIDNRLVVLNGLGPADVSIWREQGMILHPTHYGHCILPDESGPCVCGDPCWIGPQGTGCDYALYTPESKETLLADRELLIAQIERLERDNKKHPRLGQWRVRLARLDQVLEEIAEAEIRVANGEIPARPRDQLVPLDPPLEISTPQHPVTRAMRERRRKAARKAEYGPFKRKQEVPTPTNLDENTLALANTILQELEGQKIPLAPRAFAQRLGINERDLYRCDEISDQLSAHNKQYAAPQQKFIETKLDELRMQEQIMTTEELASFFGMSERHFYVKYPEYPNRLGEQNKAIRIEQMRQTAEQHLQDLVSTQTGQPTQEFAKHIQIDVSTLRKRYPDIVERLKQLNKVVGLPGVWGSSSKAERIAIIYECWNSTKQTGVSLSLSQLSEQCHFAPQTIRLLCPELIAQLAGSQEDKGKREEEALSTAFAEVKQSNQVWALKQFAATAGIPENAMRTRYRHWTARLLEHNAEVVSAKLQAAWDRMVTSEEDWSIVQFAREAELDYQTLQAHHQNWVERFRVRKASFSTAERVRRAIEDAKNSSTPITPTEVAQKVDITYQVLMRKYADQYASLIEHNKTAFGPVVEAAWSKVVESDLYPTMSEFAEMCGFRHFSILLTYFPDSAKQVRNRLK